MPHPADEVICDACGGPCIRVHGCYRCVNPSCRRKTDCNGW